jgi:hypothetical protein
MKTINAAEQQLRKAQIGGGHNPDRTSRCGSTGHGSGYLQNGLAQFGSRGDKTA